MSSPSRDHSPMERSAKRVCGSRPETDERVAVQRASDEEPDGEADEIVGYSEDGQGLKVEYISEEECAFLYDEIFVRQEYLQHGIICKLEQTGKEERQRTRLKESRQGERKGQCLEQRRIAQVLL
mmetsp:Transcript_44502/g.71524  ORF Transcript_44502/g.71524 Transcript_44502/m.71524 type:complete len:125 (+) Transcript_44502:24-398(+)